MKNRSKIVLIVAALLLAALLIYLSYIKNGKEEAMLLLIGLPLLYFFTWKITDDLIVYNRILKNGKYVTGTLISTKRPILARNRWRYSNARVLVYANGREREYQLWGYYHKELGGIGEEVGLLYFDGEPDKYIADDDRSKKRFIITSCIFYLCLALFAVFLLYPLFFNI